MAKAIVDEEVKKGDMKNLEEPSSYTWLTLGKQLNVSFAEFVGPLDVYDEHWQPVPSPDVCCIYPTSFAFSSKRTQPVRRMGRDGGGVHWAHSGSI